MAIRRDDLIAIGGFDPRYRGSSVGEDVEISLRLLRYAGDAKRFAFVGGAWLRHDSSGRLEGGGPSTRVRTGVLALLASRGLQQTFANRIRYSWILVGATLLAVAAALRRLNLRPIRAWLSGLRCILFRVRQLPVSQARKGARAIALTDLAANACGREAVPGGRHRRPQKRGRTGNESLCCYPHIQPWPPDIGGAKQRSGSNIPEFEILIVDDGSTDDTAERVERFVTGRTCSAGQAGEWRSIGRAECWNTPLHR